MIYTAAVGGSKTLRSERIDQRANEPATRQGEGADEHSGEIPRTAANHLDEMTAVRHVVGRLTDSQRAIIESHLTDCSSCRKLVEQVASWSSASRDRAASPEWTGTVLPRGLLLARRYRIRRFVARGGMGEVYEVQDESLGDRVALKTIASQFMGDAETVAQFKAEVSLARRVGHRNVCRIFDLGEHLMGDGPPIVFLTMEFIEGQSLRQHLKQRGKLPEAAARDVCIGIVQGLQAAHEAGVLHRDLKCDNVMLRDERRDSHAPVLMDFGLASALNPNSSRVSCNQGFVGSLLYMAPEQVQGEPLRIATDLYAVGVILFEMLTGRLPFQASTPALAALMRLQEVAPRLRSVDPSLSPELEAIVARCLERDPMDRFNSAQDVLAELRSVQSHAGRTPHGDQLVHAKRSVAPEAGSTESESQPTESLDHAVLPVQVPPAPVTRDAKPWRPWLLAAIPLLLGGGWLGNRWLGDGSFRSDTPAREASVVRQLNEAPPEALQQREAASFTQKPTEFAAPGGSAAIALPTPRSSLAAPAATPPKVRRAATKATTNVSRAKRPLPRKSQGGTRATLQPTSAPASSTSINATRHCPPELLCPGTARQEMAPPQ